MTRQERALKTRRMILDAAGAVFAERGYETATVLEFLSQAGVTKGAFYFHFSSKEEVALALLSEQVPQQDLLAAQKFRLQELVDVHLVLACRLSRSARARGCFRLALEQGQDGRYRRDPYVERARFNAALLTAARNGGELLPGVEVCETAEFLVSSFMGLHLMSQVLSDYADLEHRIALLFRNVLPGIADAEVLNELDLRSDRGSRLLSETGEAAAEPARRPRSSTGAERTAAPAVDPICR
ncbi:ScbR family autoregulator-binding transcription factor [Streptomyces sp. NPDC051219]|uniref:ScbR family autoregulator-binding transcription factor n=1 Tax=Streptomyces sp. NPDC051219 TaxID=3155283 RepID=UPI0034393D06